jgi:hypothetical protein
MILSACPEQSDSHPRGLSEAEGILILDEAFGSDICLSVTDMQVARRREEGRDV